MSDFSFSATARCSECGAYLSSSSEECDHNGSEVNTHVFREIGQGRDSLVGVESTIRYKWYKLEDTVGEEWKKYEWLGTRDDVNNLLGDKWSTIEELPKRAMALDAPRDVGSED